MLKNEGFKLFFSEIFEYTEYIHTETRDTDTDTDREGGDTTGI